MRHVNLSRLKALLAKAKPTKSSPILSTTGAVTLDLSKKHVHFADEVGHPLTQAQSADSLASSTNASSTAWPPTSPLREDFRHDPDLVYSEWEEEDEIEELQIALKHTQPRLSKDARPSIGTKLTRAQIAFTIEWIEKTSQKIEDLEEEFDLFDDDDIEDIDHRKIKGGKECGLYMRVDVREARRWFDKKFGGDVQESFDLAMGRLGRILDEVDELEGRCGGAKLDEEPWKGYEAELWEMQNYVVGKYIDAKIVVGLLDYGVPVANRG
jgi:hypothetical protein